MEFISNTLAGSLAPCGESPSVDVIYGQSRNMREIEQIVDKVAETNMPVLIQGERGTGKEVLARHIHLRYPGPAGPLFKISPPVPKGNALDDVALRVEKNLLGTPEGLEYAEHQAAILGTLFVKDVAELDAGLQYELLQLIQGSRSFVIGTRKDIPVKLRVICATTNDLEREVDAGRFRRDLLSTFSTARLRVPALRERREDIPQLAHYFWGLYNKNFRCHADPPSSHWISLLQRQDWPKNIWELENVIKRYVVLGSEESSGGRPFVWNESSWEAETALPAVSLKKLTRDATQMLEHKIILRTLQQTQWNRKQAAHALKISYRALLYKIKEAGLPPKRRNRYKPKERPREQGHGNNQESKLDAA